MKTSLKFHKILLSSPDLNNDGGCVSNERFAQTLSFD